jgi:branched-subunit amino acid aminotransferase/4-amino-4-deoxychorismate lyase
VLLSVRHAERLARDAARLGLGELDPQECRGALDGLAREAFDVGEGIVRLEVHCNDAGRLRLAGTARERGSDPPVWRAVCAQILHPGPGAVAGTKRADDPAIEAARAEARRAGVDEALLFDAEGRLVEGARSSTVAVLADRGPLVPPLARGGVEGIARALALESCGELEEGDVGRGDLASLCELVALNAVRGARPIVRLDGAAVGSGLPGPWARHLAEVLDKVAEPCSATRPGTRRSPYASSNTRC